MEGHGPVSWGWNRGVPLYTEVSSFQERCPHQEEGFRCIQKGVLISGVGREGFTNLLGWSGG